MAEIFNSNFLTYFFVSNLNYGLCFISILQLNLLGMKA